MSHLVEGARVLNGRFALLAVLSELPTKETWLAEEIDGSVYLLRMSFFDGESPNDVARAVWDQDLRLLYRACSSAGAPRYLMLVKDAQVDRQARCLVTVLEGPGYVPLSLCIERRQRPEWLSARGLSSRDARARLWQGLLQVGRGLRILHRQRIIHGNLTPQSVFCEDTAGPATFRMGMLDAGIRFGSEGLQNPAQPWSTPPECAEAAKPLTFDTDWYAFGMLVARCFESLEFLSTYSPRDRSQRVRQSIEQSRILSPAEQEILKGLIADDPIDRLTYGDLIIRKIQEVIHRLEGASASQSSPHPLRLVINERNTDFVDAAVEVGFRADPDPNRLYSPENPAHVAALKGFVLSDMAEAQVYAQQNGETYLLVGRRFALRVAGSPYANAGEPAWDHAFVIVATDVRGVDKASRPVSLKGFILDVVVRRQVESVRATSRNWRTVLPRSDDEPQMRERYAKLHEFLRFTNQVELLMREAEIFAYESVNRTVNNDQREVIQIRDAGTKGEGLPDYLRIKDNLCDFLQNESETGKRHCSEVLLTESGSLFIKADDLKPKLNAWTIQSVDPKLKTVKLVRQRQAGQNAAPTKGYIRTYSHVAQLWLVARRKRAIDRLEEHSYLLAALSETPAVRIDTGARDLPFEPPMNRVDESKRAVMNDILRVRPIYTMQGPPGTGKTTLVSYLLKEILQEDPAAQILVTSQGHGAVDVLRKKVLEAYEDAQEHEIPLAVRLGRDSEEADAVGSAAEVAKNILERVMDSFEARPPTTSVENDWHEIVRRWTPSNDDSDEENSGWGDFREIVKRAASITYCTTSAGDLEALAEGQQSFDWSIIEEAGKAHGFDLALPLQAGHRWLLLGDQNQLPPYRFQDFRKALGELDSTISALWRRWKEDSSSRPLIDYDLVRDWERPTPEMVTAFRQYGDAWLATFDHLYSSLANDIFPQETLTGLKPIGASAGMLKIQYRMHPAIGRVVSESFYEGKVSNGSVREDGALEPWVVHDIVQPPDLNGKAICWLDLPYCQHDGNAEEVGPDQKQPRYTNPAEAGAVIEFLSGLRRPPASTDSLEVAILSPYRRQVRLLSDRLEGVSLPPGLTYRDSLGRAGPSGSKKRLAHTVDSFQGNEADIVVVSLVRNNSQIPGEQGALGFLRDRQRINVLLSRAKRLLVIVGSLEFMLRQTEHVSLDNKGDELWNLKRAILEIQSMFSSGEAIRIPISTLSAETHT